jgi:dTDP-4-amino-4,6-dideoxygalactose transaminase
MIRLSKSCISNSEILAVQQVLKDEYLGMGRKVIEFEKDLIKLFNREVVCVSSGTAALQLALEAIGVGKGDEVIVQSLTYVASFQAIKATGASPIACDIDPLNLSTDYRKLKKLITKNTKAIMPVHFAGDPGSLKEIYKIANEHKLRVVEDAAHAFGTVYGNMLIGSFGDITCFSFDGIKNITSGEGGCVVTDDIEVLNNIRDARLLGVINDSEKRMTREKSWNFDVVKQGWRYHMSDLMAAIGIEQLKRFEVLANTRKTLAKEYDNLLHGHSKVFFFKREYHFIVPHIYVIHIKGLKNRELLRQLLLDKGIQTGVHYFPNHFLSFFKDSCVLPLDATESLYPELLTLPLHPDLKFKDIRFIVKNLIDLIDSNDKF